jgi:microcystin-dependent protein
MFSLLYRIGILLVGSLLGLTSVSEATSSPSRVVGEIRPFAGTTVPNGWLLCDGAAVSRSTHASLFQAIGATYGAGDGASTFNLPDLRGRLAVGNGPGANLTPRQRGEKLGEEAHALNVNEIPSHNHAGRTERTLSQHSHPYRIEIFEADNGADNSEINGWNGRAPVRGYAHFNTDVRDMNHVHSVPFQGSGVPHNVVQPSVAVHFIILAVLPSQEAPPIVGELRASATIRTPPGGWLVCDGSAVSRSLYNALFSVIGTAFGNGDGSTTFNVPDFRGRGAVGVGQGPGLSSRSLGSVFGERPIASLSQSFLHIAITWDGPVNSILTLLRLLLWLSTMVVRALTQSMDGWEQEMLGVMCARAPKAPMRTT